VWTVFISLFSDTRNLNAFSFLLHKYTDTRNSCVNTEQVTCEILCGNTNERNKHHQTHTDMEQCGHCYTNNVIQKYELSPFRECDYHSLNRSTNVLTELVVITNTPLIPNTYVVAICMVYYLQHATHICADENVLIVAQQVHRNAKFHLPRTTSRACFYRAVAFAVSHATCPVRLCNAACVLGICWRYTDWTINFMLMVHVI